MCAEFTVKYTLAKTAILWTRDILTDDYLFDINNRVRFIDNVFAYKKVKCGKKKEIYSFSHY